MTQNPKNNPGDESENWDFAKWNDESDDVFSPPPPSDDGDEPAFTATEEFPDNSFGESSFGADDAAFGNGEAFASDDDAAFGVADDEAFPTPDEEVGFESMPSPGGIESFGGDPDTDFADLGNSDGGFGSDISEQQNDVFGSNYDGDENFEHQSDDGGFNVDQQDVDEGFSEPAASVADDEDDEFEQSSANDNEKTGFDLKKFIFPAAIAATVLGVGWIGWSTVSPMLMGSSTTAPEVVASAPVDPTPSFPTALPGQQGGNALPPVATLPAEVAPPVVGATEPVALPELAPSVETALPELPSLTTTPELPAVADVSAPQTTTLPAASKQVEYGDLVGGSDRGGIDAIKTSAPTESQSADIAALTDRVSAMEVRLDQKIDDLSNKLDGFLSTMTSADAGIAAPAGMPTLPEQTITPVPVASSGDHRFPPLKPLIVEKATLKGVSRDMGWIDTKSGVVEVKIGDALPVGGTVLNFVNYRGSWLAVTSEGLITQ